MSAMDTQVKIRMATPADAEQLLNIYTPYVLETAVTFEIEPPTLEDFTGRIERILERYPYIVAEKEGTILGYAYANSFRPRAAYSHAAESSIYIRKDLRSRGLGRRLYEALAKLLLLQNVFNMEACIAHCEPADEYVPAASRLFHTRLGFRLAGTFKGCALKFGRWYDMIWMERILATRSAQETMPFRALPDIDQPYIDAVLNNA
jgi:L-amino acid N-acyltransferase YncA